MCVLTLFPLLPEQMFMASAADGILGGVDFSLAQQRQQRMVLPWVCAQSVIREGGVILL